MKAAAILSTGVALGMAIVVTALVREAQNTVEARLSGQVWSLPGRVYSAPLKIWPGLAMSPGELATDLRSAGYTQVETARQEGDFQVGDSAILVKGKEASGPGWAVPAGDVLVNFRGTRVSSVSPRSPATFSPAIMATLSGPSAQRRELVPLGRIPHQLQQAVLVMEDRDFRKHSGISFVGVCRAALVNTLAGETVQGGSTITQQLAKNLFLSPERSYARKAREVFLAMAIEDRLSKDEILELYLNGVYLGQAAGQAIHGVAEAARVYFGKQVERIDLGEAATLAGIISAPNAYSPLRNTERARERRDLVLRRLLEDGLVDEAQESAARQQALLLRPTNLSSGATWAVDLAVDLAEAAQGAGSVTARGLRLDTTLLPPLQRLASQAVKEGLAEIETRYPRARGVQVALLALEASTGEIMAVVGGRDYSRSSFNRAFYAKRQLGSVVKPLTLVEALDKDPSLHLSTLLDDKPLELNVGGRTWRPTNYDGRYEGRVTVRRAIVHSRNVPCIHLARRVGMKNLKSFWLSLGLEGATALPSAALGAFDATPVQVASAYTIFPSGGSRAAPFLLRSISEPDGRMLSRKAHRVVPAVSARAASLARQVLLDVIKSGTGASASRYGVSGAVGGKTGTTDNGRDAWFVGFSPDLVVAVWVGFDRGASHGLSGARAALPIWARFMEGVGASGASFGGGEHLVSVKVCVESHEPATDECPETYLEWFDSRRLPKEHCQLHGSVHGMGEHGQQDPAGSAPQFQSQKERLGLIGRLREKLGRKKEPGDDDQ